jgi:hypothetical protein
MVVGTTSQPRQIVNYLDSRIFELDLIGLGQDWRIVVEPDEEAIPRGHFIKGGCFRPSEEMLQRRPLDSLAPGRIFREGCHKVIGPECVLLYQRGGWCYAYLSYVQERRQPPSAPP